LFEISELTDSIIQTAPAHLSVRIGRHFQKLSANKMAHRRGGGYGGGFSGKSRRAPQPPPRLRAADADRELSLVAAYDELARNCSVLVDGQGEEVFVQFVRRTATLAKRWREAELSRQEAVAAMRERDKDLLAKDYKIKQARKIVEDERRGRLQAEAERDAFAKQVSSNVI